MRLDNRGINLCMSGNKNVADAYYEPCKLHGEKIEGTINSPWVRRIVTFSSKPSFFSGLFCCCPYLKSSSLFGAHLT